MRPELPKVDEFGRPWTLVYTRGKTPAQEIYYATIKQQVPAQGTQVSTQPREDRAQASQGAQDRPGSRPVLQVRNGVVDDMYLYMMRDGKLRKNRLPEQIPHAGHLLQLCLEAGLDALWIVPETTLSDRATRDFIEYPEAGATWDIKNAQYTDPRAYEDKQARCTYLKAWKRPGSRAQGETGRAVHLGYAEHNSRWELDTVTNPVHLLGALTYLEDALHFPVRYGPASVGKHLMQAVNKGEREAWVVPVDLSECPPVTSTRVNDVLWKRSFTEEEQSKPYMIAADKNSMFPASCTSVLLGEGEPEHVERPAFNLKKPLAGVYFCSVSGTSEFDGVTLPHPTDGVMKGWFWVYTVKLLHELGYTVDIEEAYVWPWENSHATLRPWAELLWNVRATLDVRNPLCDTERYISPEARALAYNAVKPVLNMSIGLLAKPREYDGYKGSTDWYRPDWNALIIDNARYQMFWRIRFMMAKGYKPVGVLADCLYYIVDSDEPAQALPGMFDRSDKLGGYKRKFKRTITASQVAPLFNNSLLDIGQVNKALLDHDRGRIEL